MNVYKLTLFKICYIYGGKVLIIRDRAYVDINRVDIEINTAWWISFMLQAIIRQHNVNLYMLPLFISLTLSHAHTHTHTGIYQGAHIATGCDTRLRFKVGLMTVPCKNFQAPFSSPFGDASGPGQYLIIPKVLDTCIHNLLFNKSYFFLY